MTQPRPIDAITVDDLKSRRWCYFHDDDEGCDGFEYVIPDTHPKFDENIMELELASFTFTGGHVRYGRFDGAKCFSVFLKGEWFSLWSGVSEPSQAQIQAFRDVLSEESLVLPVIAKAHWSGALLTYGGLRYYNKNREEAEINV